MAMLECPDCEIRLRRGKCPNCGWTPPVEAVQHERSQGPRRCWVDGALLRANDFCEIGGGYMLGVTCPFACPLCRHPLTWEGACMGCHGTTTGRREDWSLPGDRYEQVGQHWVKQAGPQPALSQGEVQELLIVLNATLARAAR